MSKDIHALLDHLGHYTFFLAGHDFGGIIAYSLAAAYPKSVRRVAVFKSLGIAAERKSCFGFLVRDILSNAGYPGWYMNLTALGLTIMSGTEDISIKEIAEIILPSKPMILSKIRGSSPINFAPIHKSSLIFVPVNHKEALKVVAVIARVLFKIA